MVEYKTIQRMLKKNPNKEIHLEVINFKLYNKKSEIKRFVDVGAIGKIGKYPQSDAKNRIMLNVVFEDCNWYLYPVTLKITTKPITKCKLPIATKKTVAENIPIEPKKSKPKKEKTLADHKGEDKFTKVIHKFNVKVTREDKDFFSKGAIGKVIEEYNQTYIVEFKDNCLAIFKRYLEPTDEPITNAIITPTEPKLGDHFELTNPKDDFADKGSVGEFIGINRGDMSGILIKTDDGKTNEEDVYHLKYKDGQTEPFLKHKLTKTDKPITTQRPSTDKPKPQFKHGDRVRYKDHQREGIFQEYMKGSSESSAWVLWDDLKFNVGNYCCDLELILNPDPNTEYVEGHEYIICGVKITYEKLINIDPPKTCSFQHSPTCKKCAEQKDVLLISKPKGDDKNITAFVEQLKKHQPVIIIDDNTMPYLKEISDAIMKKSKSVIIQCPTPKKKVVDYKT